MFGYLFSLLTGFGIFFSLLHKRMLNDCEKAIPGLCESTLRAPVRLKTPGQNKNFLKEKNTQGLKLTTKPSFFSFVSTSQKKRAAVALDKWLLRFATLFWSHVSLCCGTSLSLRKVSISNELPTIAFSLEKGLSLGESRLAITCYIVQ